MRALLRLSAGIDACNRRLGRAVSWLLLVMVLVGAYNALARWLEGEGIGIRLSSNALLELQWYLFGLVVLLGAPHALRLGDHVRVDLIQGGLPQRGRWWLDLAGGVLFLIPFCLGTVWLSLDFVADSWEQREISNDPGGLPRWPLKPVVPISFALLALQGASECIKRAALLRGIAGVPALDSDERGDAA